MFGTDAPDHEALVERRRSRRIVWGLVGVGCLAYVAGLVADRPLVGLAVYWLCGVGFVAYGFLSNAEPYDERDLEIQGKAAGSTLAVAAAVLIAGAPGMSALEAAGVYAASSWYWGAMFALAGIFGAFAVSMWYHGRKT